MSLTELGRLGKKTPRLGASQCASLPFEILQNFPGAAFIVGRDGSVTPVGPGASDFAPEFSSYGYMDEIAVRAGHAIARRIASVEVMDMGGGTPVEATMLPLDGADQALVLLRPIEFATAFHRQLIESRQRYKDFVETISDFCWETDRDGRFTFISPKGALDWAPDEMVGRSVGEFLAGSDEDGPIPEIFRTDRFSQNDDIWFRSADGALECLSVVASPRFSDDGEWLGGSGLCRKITRERRDDRETAQMRLRTNLAIHLAHTLQEETDPRIALGHAVSAIGLALCATGGVVLRGNMGETPTEVSRWGDAYAEEMVIRAIGLRDDGVPIDDTYEDLHFIGISAGFHDTSNGMAVFWRRIDHGLFIEDDRSILEAVERPLGTAIARLTNFESALSKSRTDALTGMLNRAAFQEEASRRIIRLDRTSHPACLFFIDLNNFKLVNDKIGHHEGDAVLIEVAQMLRDSTRANDLAGRLGGDEFVVWIDRADQSVAVQRAKAMLDRCSIMAGRTGDPSRPFGASIGLAVYDPARPETIEQLLMRADVAMYQAKRHKSGYAVAKLEEPGQ